MRITLLRPDLDNDYLFQISEGSKPILNSIDYAKKVNCLDHLQEVLLDLRNNEQISIQAGNDEKYYFEVANLAQSASFDDLGSASDALAELKAYSLEKNSFSIFFNQPSQQVVSKKQLGLREEAYDFSKKSISKKSGFELMDTTSPKGHYFHFNDKKGNALFFSRMFDGKTRRLKAIINLIKNAKNEKRFEIINQDAQYFFLFKDKKGYEIGRSKSFNHQNEIEAAIAFVRATAPKFEKQFPLPKKKNKKRKAKEKYHLKQVAPFGIIGFEGFKNAKNKLHYFHYHDEVGQGLLFSKPYEKRSLRDKAIAFVIKNGGKKKSIKTWKKGKQNHYFSIIGSNGKSFA